MYAKFFVITIPRLQRKTLSMPQSSPGRYASNVSLPLAGSYHLEIAVKQNGQVVYRQSRGLMRGYSDELRIRPTNEELLREVASLSGGQFNPTAKELLTPGTARATRPTPLWPTLITIAALLLVVDVLLRRIDLALYLPLKTA